MYKFIINNNINIDTLEYIFTKIFDNIKTKNKIMGEWLWK